MDLYLNPSMAGTAITERNAKRAEMVLLRLKAGTVQAGNGLDQVRSSPNDWMGFPYNSNGDCHDCNPGSSDCCGCVMLCCIA